MAVLTTEYRRYLRLVGVEAAAPTLPLLRALVAAHLYRVRFENISKLLLYGSEGIGRPISLTEFLDGIEHHDLGGTCYTSNPFLCELLVALGYDAALLGADMSNPNVHTSIRVRLEGVTYHVDVGYAAPFREPMRLDRLPHAITNGGTRYVLASSDAPDCYVMTQFVSGGAPHRYIVHPPERPREFFTPTVVASFEPGKTFMDCLRLSRQFPDGTADLHDTDLVITRSNVVSSHVVKSLSELRNVVDGVFAMPRSPVERAVGILEQVTGRKLFG